MQKAYIRLALVLKTSRWYRFHPFYHSYSPVLRHTCQRLCMGFAPQQSKLGGLIVWWLTPLWSRTSTEGIVQSFQPNPQRNKKRKIYAIKQIKICAEYRDMQPRPRPDLSGTPGLRHTSLGLGSISRYAAQILICIIYYRYHKLLATNFMLANYLPRESHVNHHFFYIFTIISQMDTNVRFFKHSYAISRYYNITSIKVKHWWDFRLENYIHVLYLLHGRLCALLGQIRLNKIMCALKESLNRATSPPKTFASCVIQEIWWFDSSIKHFPFFYNFLLKFFLVAVTDSVKLSLDVKVEHDLR